jgi:hypothetical protein
MILEIVMKDCISTWQKATIRDALPDEYKDKTKQEAAEASHKRYESGQQQATEFADSGENGNNLQDSNLAGSETFEGMNRGQDIVTDSERVEKLKERISQVEEEKEMIRRENQILRKRHSQSF